MSATAAAAAEALPAKGKKKLIIIIAAVLVLALAGGGGAMVMLKKKPVDTEEESGDAGGHGDATAAVSKRDPHAVPVFVPLEPFTVNLADRDAEHYAQVGITLEIEDAKTGEQIKLYMPAIRNNILLAIADRSAAELMGREGKTKLADKIKRETARALGIQVGEPDAEVADEAAANAEDPPKKKKKKARKAEPLLPVKAVHFSNFIIQ